MIAWKNNLFVEKIFNFLTKEFKVEIIPSEIYIFKIPNLLKSSITYLSIFSQSLSTYQEKGVSDSRFPQIYWGMSPLGPQSIWIPQNSWKGANRAHHRILGKADKSQNEKKKFQTSVLLNSIHNFSWSIVLNLKSITNSILRPFNF